MTENGVLEFVREDDYVEYYLFPDQVVQDNREEEQMINSVLREARQITKNTTQDYLWHRDQFTLTARTSVSNMLSNEGNRESLPSHLHGITHYGDNIEDEWFIVYLLVTLTKNIKGSIARITDTDGEFLLIEAAEFLPEWAKPEICDKRVYIYNGLIHIVAPEATNDNDSDIIPEVSIVDTLQTIRNNPSLTVASPEIQNAIKHKIAGYPTKIKENVHSVKLYLPVAIAAILAKKPNLISPAVLAFVNRDQVDLRACRAMKYFPPEHRVYTSVRFTKCLYAMLTHSKYVPDRKTGWNLPQATGEGFKAHNLGVRVACGFEILAAQARVNGDLDGDKGWHTYVNSLKARNYFKELLEHSQEYNNLLNKAKEYYINHRDSLHCAPIQGQEILNLMRSLDYTVDEFKRNEKNIPLDDNEEWLNVSPEELDKMLIERYGTKKTLTVNKQSNATNFTKKITQFLEHISDLEGAEYPNQPEQSPIRPPRKPKPSSNDGNISFDPNSFTCHMQNILNFVIPEDDSWDLDSDSDMEDYGKEEEVPMDYGELKSKMEEYMKQMDAELATTTIGESFEKKEETFDDIESFKPVDIDMTALKNILESYKSQMGEAGPSTNMLGPMGIHLDKPEVIDSE